MITERAYIYILANRQKRLYTGVTAKLRERVREHKQHIHPLSFTARYRIDQLVYVETHLSIVEAIAREKQIKGWLRIKKIHLIVAQNPDWRDLSLGWDEAVFFDETTLGPPTAFL